MTQQCFSQLMAAADEPEQLSGRAARNVGPLAVTSLLSTPLGQGHRHNQAVVPWSLVQYLHTPHGTKLPLKLTNLNRLVAVNIPWFFVPSQIMCHKLQIGLSLQFLKRYKNAIYGTVNCSCCCTDWTARLLKAVMSAFELLTTQV